MLGMSARSSIRIVKDPVIRPGVRFVSEKAAAVESAAASFAFGGILGEINPSEVEGAAPHAKRLFDTLRAGGPA